ncbi:MAG: hypothetical protein OEZ40_09390, partial [Candidatus Bathyarchaeota archaeon]|nr:hypothetical protein [Candidatus Bathyarchaeota archaeon]
MDESKTEVENARILTEEGQRQNDKEACILDSAISEKNEEMEVPNVEKEQKIQELLKSINDEASQLNGFLIEERKLTHEICMSLKYVLNELH